MLHFSGRLAGKSQVGRAGMNDFGDAKALVCMAYIATALIVLATRKFAVPPAMRLDFTPTRSIGRWLVDPALRLAVIAYAFALLFAVSWRPIYGCFDTISLFVIFTGISRAKYGLIREPLNFTDLALVPDVLKHKELFQATWLDKSFWAGAFLYVFGSWALMMWLEPGLLPASGTLIVYGLVAWLCLPAVLLWRPSRALVDKLIRLAVGPQHDDVLRVGTFETIVLHLLMWFGSVPAIDDPDREMLDGKGRPSQLIVVWQSESFLDIRRLGLNVSLPALDVLAQVAGLRPASQAEELARQIAPAA